MTLKAFFISLICTSMILLLYPVMGCLSVVVWIVNSVILTLIARYVLRRERDDLDSWGGI
ncbi:Uncharacterised protein [Serratia ficaria]|uniref:hypothetical protein n=1 Tax=Serratia ficaria TaxID=61651 RepID=UPI00217A7150|nr:hypothetical protein [Serratia ficaria]CAI1056432.1 Uncharacterised protein [Serratia ficaria]CAI1803577.1 Uncharacterised protein [Serratia ficaria]CAI2519933.1 Uncharacterised protein [Serratia ficaria]CAI2791829.1 Uncharacterised protein [Serratia ficaria]